MNAPIAAQDPLLLPLTDRRALEVELVGAKAAHLARLKQAGLPVPRAVVISAACWRRVIGNRAGSIASVEALLAAERVVSTSLAHCLEASLAGPLAVRSSGVQEDGSACSFAGMYHTSLGVRGANALAAAIRRCWVSGVGAWKQAQTIYPSEQAADAFGDLPRMAVLVQEMIEPEYAGVLFTVNPVNGDEESMLCEWCEGLADKLVDGRVVPRRAVIGRFTGTVEPTVAAADVSQPPPRMFDQLRSLARTVDTCFGSPQDIEWAYRDGEVLLLQSRPITQIHHPRAIGQWTTADFRDGGVSAHVVTPLMWSLYRSIWNDALPDYFARVGIASAREMQNICWGRVFFGRPYWNVGQAKRFVSRLPGFVEGHFDDDLAIPPSYPGTGKTTPVTLSSLFRGLPVLWKLRRDYRRQLAANRALVPEAEQLVSLEAHCQPERLDDLSLINAFQRLVEVEYPHIERNYFFTVFNLSNTKLELKEALDVIHRKTGGGFSYLRLISAIDDLATLRPLQDLRLIADDVRHQLELRGKSLTEVIASSPVRRRLDKFLQDHGHHGSAELDLSVARWVEQPEQVEQLLIDLVRADVAAATSDDDEKRKSVNERERLDRALARRHPLRWRLLGRAGFTGKLRRVREYIFWREEMRDRSMRVYLVIRRMTRELARRLVVGRVLERESDAFFLEYEQLVSLFREELSVRQAQSLVRFARERYERFRDFENPNEIGIPSAPPTGGANSPELVPRKDCFQGIGCSPGVVEGPARILRSPTEGSLLRSGDILVAPFTDPGWTPLFGIVNGVVTETGGVLSHAAVIARETGRPAVSGLARVTRTLHDGEMIRIDGERGTLCRLTPLRDSQSERGSLST